MVQAEWWERLTPAQRDALIESDPHEIGKLAGVTPVDRDRANRLALQREINSLEQQVAAARAADREYAATHPPSGRGMSRERQAIRRKLNNLVKRERGAKHLWNALHEVAARKGDSIERKDVLLLDFDTSFTKGEGKAVVAIGDPSKAEYMGVVVPGITNNLNNFGRTLEKAANLRHTTDRRFGREISNKTSTIAWLGYDTPDTLVDSFDQDEALEGAHHLAKFVSGLRAMRDRGSNAWAGNYSLSIFGHSYGSTTSALATFYGLVAENLALVGSPGGYAQTAQQLKGAKKVWAGRAWDDGILLAAISGFHGGRPTSSKFGATEMHLGGEKLGHGDYFRLGTTSVRNMAAILVGRDEMVRTR